MATKKPHLKIQCLKCKRVNYFTKKSKAAAEKKLEMKKYCRWCKAHTPHKEAKR